MTRIFTTLLLGFCLLTMVASRQKQAPVNWKKVKVLVYTKNGKGYVHDNIPFAAAAIQKLGQTHGFSVDVSDQPAVFTEGNLKQYTMLVFPSTNNDVFDTNDQRLAFRRYIEAGGGFVGIHSVMGTERNWTWFKRMMGGTFAWHPRFQKLKIHVLDPSHPSMEGLPKVWEKEDECYFAKEMSPGPTVIMAHDLTVLNPADAEKITQNRGSYTELYPAAWYYNYDGGYTWCTALGHHKNDYQDPTFVQHIFQGMRYVASQVKKVDFGKAYATSHEMAIQ
ncbi:hypothetical protein GCM10023189_29310 [Nibrella saemangeumensis]|uniref:ThuA-like domain-containing protein n=1 Tax=Nibrella saemangeumensis TaxID=1084526 RepID=A0ABP8N0D1_9BACT